MFTIFEICEEYFFIVFTHTRNRHFRKSGAIFIFVGDLQTGWMTVQTFFCRLLMKLDYVHRILKCKWCCGDSFPLPATILCEDDRETSRCRTNLKYSTHLYFNIRCTQSNFIKNRQKKIVPPRNHILKQSRYWQSVHYYGNAQKVYIAVLKKNALYNVNTFFTVI